MKATTLAGLLLLAAASLAGAQNYPTKPIRLISPYPPGGGNDTLARILLDKVSEGLGQRVIVDNRPGANTIVGTEMLAKSPPDGHTIILLPNSFVTNPAMYRKLPYDSVKDFTPIGLLALSPNMLVAHLSLPVKTIKELIALEKKKPGQFTFASSGTGSTGHLSGVLFNMMTGAKLEHIAYKGTAPAVTELLGGHVPLMMSSMLATLPHVRTGRLRILGLTTAKRSPALPDIPTIAEAGVPGYESTLWYGMLAPGGTPAPVVQKLNDVFGRALQAPDVIERLSSQGVEPYHSSPAGFAKLIQDEIPKWTKVIAVAGVTAE